MTKRLDTPKNLTGLSSLLKKQTKIDQSVDLQKFEQDIIGKNRSTLMSKSSKTSGGDCVREVNALLGNLDIDLESDIVSKRNTNKSNASKSSKSSKGSKSNKNKKKSKYSDSDSESTYDSSSESESSSDSSSDKNIRKSSKKSSSSKGIKRSSKKSKSSSSSSSGSSSYSSSSSGSRSRSSGSSYSSSRSSRSSSSSGSSRSSKSYKSSKGKKLASTMGINPNYDLYGNGLKEFTEEQKTQYHINNVLSQMDTNKSGFSLEEERSRDWKINALNEISELRSILEVDGEDLRHVPMPTMNDSDNLIRDVRTTLQYKNNRILDFGLAENLASAAAYGIETVFNGEREFFGSYIDMTGWHVNVKQRLRRRKFETTEFVSGIMREYKIGPPIRLGLELVFDAIMHHKSRQSRTMLSDGRTIPSEINTNDAIADLREDFD
jgi:hypothetical protein